MNAGFIRIALVSKPGGSGESGKGEGTFIVKKKKKKKENFCV